MMGCSSQSGSVRSTESPAYKQTSASIDALENEQKAWMRLEMAAENYSKSPTPANQQEYTSKKQELIDLRAQNHAQGLEVGPALPTQLSPAQEIAVLRKNHDAVSERVRELTQKRNDIVNAEMGVVAKEKPVVQTAATKQDREPVHVTAPPANNQTSQPVVPATIARQPDVKDNKKSESVPGLPKNIEIAVEAVQPTPKTPAVEMPVEMPVEAVQPTPKTPDVEMPVEVVQPTPKTPAVEMPVEMPVEVVQPTPKTPAVEMPVEMPVEVVQPTPKTPDVEMPVEVVQPTPKTPDVEMPVEVVQPTPKTPDAEMPVTTVKPKPKTPKTPPAKIKPALQPPVPDETESTLDTKDIVKYRVLVIANNKYKDRAEKWVPLKTPQANAKGLIAVLRQKYGVSADRLQYITDATRKKMESAFATLYQQVRHNESVVICYFGHGYYDSDNDESFWISVDVKDDSENHFVSNSWLREWIVKIGQKAQHVLLIAGTAFAPTMVIRKAKGDMGEDGEKMLAKSCQVLAAGESEYQDQKYQRNSQSRFVYLLVQELKRGRTMSASQLATAMKKTLKTLQFGVWKGSQDRGGEFLFRAPMEEATGENEESQEE
jgi:hypothetical protein